MEASMSAARIVKHGEAPAFDRGNGVATTLLVGRETAPDTVFTSGTTTFPPGRGAPMHSHNCGEQVLILEGEAEVEIDGVVDRVGPRDTTYIPAGLPHRFTNIGDKPLTILWIYGATHVTRTFAATGETVEHLSGGDRVGALA
jgi:quercetin dioxygenase-like cupin family protein